MRCTTSSRSTAPIRNRSIARRSAGDSGLMPGQLVDEQPVAAVGRHPAGARVRLPQVALVLQHGHVVAYGGGGHPQLVALDQGPAADRLLGRDVVLDDGAQHVELALVEGHRTLPSSRRSSGLAPARCECAARQIAAGSGSGTGTSRVSECQCYGIGVRRADDPTHCHSGAGRSVAATLSAMTEPGYQGARRPQSAAPQRTAGAPAHRRTAGGRTRPPGDGAPPTGYANVDDKHVGADRALRRRRAAR